MDFVLDACWPQLRYGAESTETAENENRSEAEGEDGSEEEAAENRSEAADEDAAGGAAVEDNMEPQLVLWYTSHNAKQQEQQQQPRRRRRNRWADVAPPSYNAPVTKKQRSRSRWSVVNAADATKLELIALQIRIQDVQSQLAAPNCVIGIGVADAEDSPSPAPEYDVAGVRTNTRVNRTRDRLTAERAVL